MSSLRVLLVDDAPDQTAILGKYLSVIKDISIDVESSNDPFDAEKRIKEKSYDLVITDYMMPGMTGLDLLRRAKEINPLIKVIVVTSRANVEEAVRFMKDGAYDFLPKPVRREALQELITDIWEKSVVASENLPIREILNKSYQDGLIISNSPQMEEILSLASRAARGKSTIMIRGESGTGKELIAHTIHLASNRKDKPFVVVNIASLSENLIESELFGHAKGAFTGAAQDRSGRFSQAHEGTLFLDEAGDIPLTVQVKLLRALQFGTFEPVGSNEEQVVDVRIIAATNQNLEEMIRAKTFRQDLYYRLNVITITIPPLRDRKSDIGLLTEHLLLKFGEKDERPVRGITNAALDKLMKYSFPGNVRELENIIERALVLCRGEVITEKDIFINPQFQDPDQEESSMTGVLDAHNLYDSYQDKMHEFEKTMLQQALEENHGNQSAAARKLGITERRLRYRMGVLGIQSFS